MRSRQWYVVVMPRVLSSQPTYASRTGQGAVPRQEDGALPVHVREPRRLCS